MLPFPVDFDSPDFEIHAYRRDVIPGEGVVREPNEKRALPNARVTDDEQLKEVVVVPASGGAVLGHRVRQKN